MCYRSCSSAVGVNRYSCTIGTLASNSDMKGWVPSGLAHPVVIFHDIVPSIVCNPLVSVMGNPNQTEPLNGVGKKHAFCVFF